MATYFLWGSIGILTLFLLIGLLAGLVRGLKRSSLHLLVFVFGVLLAFFITKPIASAILGIKINMNGEVVPLNEIIINMIKSSFDISQYETATEFMKNLPNAVVSPILFIVLALVCIWVLDIIYVIVARLCFGKKKEDFKSHKPHRWLGGLVGTVEGFLLLFVIFSPLTALTKTYQQIATSSSQAQVSSQAEKSENLKTIPELVSQFIPKEVDEALVAYNNSAVGKLCQFGGLDEAMFDGLSNFKMDGEKVELRKELLNITSTYNKFVVVYNDFAEKDFENIDITELKKDIEVFLNNGLFKKVLTGTVKEFVVNFDESKIELPKLAKDVVLKLKTTFSAENFDAYEYLKSDILDVLDVAELLLKGEILESYTNLPEEKESAEILEIVGKNNDEAQKIVGKVFDMNIIKDCYSIVKDELKEILNDVNDFLSVDGLGNTTKEFKEEFSLIGDALHVLANGNITVSESQMSYLKYALSSDFAVEKLLDEMLKDDTLTTLLDPIFEADSFTPLVQKVFDEIDTTIGEYTKVTPTTKLTKLKETKSQTISAVKDILETILNADMENIKLAEVGKILDILKVNAKCVVDADGKYDGVFNEIFANLIWYVSGTDLTGDYADVKVQPHENADDVLNCFKVYFDVEVKKNFYDANYQTIMADLDNVIKLANSLIEKIPEDLSFAGEIPPEFVDGLKDSVANFKKEDVVEVVENLTDIAKENIKYDFISQEDIDNNKDKIETAIADAVNGAFVPTTDEEIAQNQQIIDAVKDLLGLTSVPLG